MFRHNSILSTSGEKPFSVPQGKTYWLLLTTELLLQNIAGCFSQAGEQAQAQGTQIELPMTAAGIQASTQPLHHSTPGL